MFESWSVEEVVQAVGSASGTFAEVGYGMNLLFSSMIFSDNDHMDRTRLRYDGL